MPNPLLTIEQEKAADLYEDFTDMKADKFLKYPHVIGAVAAGIGKLDFLELETKTITFNGNDRPVFAASADGRKLLLIGVLNEVTRRTISQFMGQKVRAIGYSTVRQRRPERYRHPFKNSSAPTVRMIKGELVLTGGSFVFKDTGINDI